MLPASTKRGGQAWWASVVVMVAITKQTAPYVSKSIREGTRIALPVC